jgi:large subunit ribosomal protein L10
LAFHESCRRPERVLREGAVRKEEKVQEVKNLSDRVEKAKVLLFADYRGLKVSEVTELRMKLRKEQSSLKVVKNRLMKRVLKQFNIEFLEKYFTGPTALAASDVDPVVPAKALVEFARTHGKLSLKGGYLDGKDLTAAQIEALAKMPSREVLLARALSSMMAPATNLVGVLAAVPRKLVYAVNAIKEKKQS